MKSQVINQKATAESEQLLNENIDSIEVYHNGELIANILPTGILTVCETTTKINRIKS